jgi:hypothetical protein
LVTLLINVASALVAHPGADSAVATAALATSIVAALLIPVFWLASSLLIDAGARQMGATSAKTAFREASGRLYPILVIYGALALLAAVLGRWAPGMSAISGVVVPVLALMSLGWFVAATAVAVHRVYQVPGLSATALAFLPYGALSALLIVFVLVVSVLQAI